jgi:hypothetical protein
VALLVDGQRAIRGEQRAIVSRHVLAAIEASGHEFISEFDMSRRS